ncbi:MAG: DUF1573 domain-containing protein [Bacteroidetes bacterium]|nr:DUF1573 domain-containing protein [Bacteroidota bacterium]
MKKIISFLTVCLLAIPAWAQIQFTEMVWDFGEIEEGVMATHVFTFKNAGSKEEKLQNVRASCGCTTPRWTRDAIAPGKTGEIEVTYNSKGRPGPFTKSITVTTDTARTATPIILTIKGNVRKAPEPATQPGGPKAEVVPAEPAINFEHRAGNLSIEKRSLSLGVLSSDKPMSAPFKVRNEGPQPLQLKGLKGAQPMYALRWENAMLKPGESTTGTLYVDPVQGEASGLTNKTAFTHQISFETNDAQEPLKTLETTGSYRKIYSEAELAAMPVIDFPEKEFNGGEILQGDVIEHTFAFRNKGKGELTLSSVKASCGCTTPSWTQEPVPAGGTGTIKVVFNSAGKTGPQHKTVVVRSNDPENDSVVLHVKCTIKADPFGSSGNPLNPSN